MDVALRRSAPGFPRPATLAGRGPCSSHAPRFTGLLTDRLPGRWTAGLTVLASILLLAAPAIAQELSPQSGDEVLLLLHDGTWVSGILLDQVPTGYLVRVESDGGTTRVVPYESVSEIRGADEGATSPAPELRPRVAPEEPPRRPSALRFFKLVDVRDDGSSDVYELRPGGSRFDDIPDSAWRGSWRTGSGSDFRLLDEGGVTYDVEGFYDAIGKGSAYRRARAAGKAAGIAANVFFYGGWIVGGLGGAGIAAAGLIFVPMVVAGVVMLAVVAPIIWATARGASGFHKPERLYEEAVSWTKEQRVAQFTLLQLSLPTPHRGRADVRRVE